VARLVEVGIPGDGECAPGIADPTGDIRPVRVVDGRYDPIGPVELKGLLAPLLYSVRRAG
jgi:hypothetical protein